MLPRKKIEANLLERMKNCTLQCPVYVLVQRESARIEVNPSCAMQVQDTPILSSIWLVIILTNIILGIAHCQSDFNQYCANIHIIQMTCFGSEESLMRFYTKGMEMHLVEGKSINESFDYTTVSKENQDLHEMFWI